MHRAEWKACLNHIENLRIPLPPTLTEQRAIATALSDVDELIAALDRLIAKKKAIKQGAMQELLTGKRRLSGFSGEWEVTKIKETFARMFLRMELLNDGNWILAVNQLDHRIALM